MKHVLIVGAGPTGLTTALEMKRHGIDVSIIDKRDAHSSLSRAVGISPSSMKILAPSGVTDDLLAEGIIFEEAIVYRDDKQLAKIPFRTQQDEHDYNFMLGLAQDRTEAIIANKLGELEVKISYSTELLNFTQHDDKVSAHFSNGDTLECDYIVGADGVDSTVRQIAQIAYPGYDIDETWSIADVRAKNWLHPNTFTLCQVEEGGVVVVAPMEQERYRLVSNTPDALKSLPIEMDVSEIKRAATFNISIRQVREYSKGCVFLVGDAAHCHSPVGGRGMNLGISDAAELARRMAEGTLDGYSASRHKEGASIIGETERIRKIITSQNPIIRGFLYAGVVTINRIPLLQRFVARKVL